MAPVNKYLKYTQPQQEQPQRQENKYLKYVPANDGQDFSSIGKPVTESQERELLRQLSIPRLEPSADPLSPIGSKRLSGPLPSAPKGYSGGIAKKGATSPIGAPIDRARPRLENDDGSFSTEETITIPLNGKWYNVPTIVGGKRVGQGGIEEALARGDSVEHVGEFGSLDEAERAARLRTSEIGRLREGEPPPLLAMSPEEKERLRQERSSAIDREFAPRWNDKVYSGVIQPADRWIGQQVENIDKSLPFEEQRRQVSKAIAPALERSGRSIGGMLEGAGEPRFGGMAQEVGESLGGFASRIPEKPLGSAVETAVVANEMLNPFVPGSRAFGNYGAAIDAGVKGDWQEVSRLVGEANVEAVWAAVMAVPLAAAAKPYRPSPLTPVPPTPPRAAQGGPAAAAQPPAVIPPAASGAGGGPPPPGVLRPVGTPPAGGGGQATRSFNAMDPKTREGVTRLLENSGVRRGDVAAIIRDLDTLPAERRSMYGPEIVRRYGTQYPELEANIAAVGREFAVSTPKPRKVMGVTLERDSARQTMNDEVRRQIDSEGDFVIGRAEREFGPGSVATKEAIDQELEALSAGYQRVLNPRNPYGTVRRNNIARRQEIDAARTQLATRLKQPDVMGQVPQWVRDKVMIEVSNDLRRLRFTDQERAIILQGNPELAPLFTPDAPLSYSPQLWNTLADLYPTQVGHSLQSAYAKAIRDVRMTNDPQARTLIDQLGRLRGRSPVRANAANPDNRGFGLLADLEAAAPGYKAIRQEFGTAKGVEDALTIPRKFIAVSKNEMNAADFIDELEELTPRQLASAESQITSIVRQAVRNKIENPKLSELGRAGDGPMTPNLTALSHQQVLSLLEDAFGAKGKEMADAIRWARSNTDYLTSIHPKYNSRTGTNIEDAKNARNLYEDPAGADVTVFDRTAQLATAAGVPAAFIPGGQGIAVSMLTLAGAKALYNSYKAGKRLSPKQRSQLADFLFRSRTAAGPEDLERIPGPKGPSPIGYAGNVAVGAGVGAGAGAAEAAVTGGDPTEGAIRGAAIGAGAGGARAGLRARKATQSIIPPQGTNGLVSPPRPPARQGFFSSGSKPPSQSSGVTAYRGLQEPFNETKYADDGHEWWTANRSDAESYARGDQGEILEGMLNTKNAVTVDAKGSHFSAIPIRSLPADIRKEVERLLREEISPELAKQRYRIDQTVDTDLVVIAAENLGKKNVVFKNVIDDLNGFSEPTTIFAIGDRLARSIQNKAAAKPFSADDLRRQVEARLRAKAPPSSQGFGSKPDLPMDEGAERVREWGSDGRVWWHSGNVKDHFNQDAGELGMHLGDAKTGFSINNRSPRPVRTASGKWIEPPRQLQKFYVRGDFAQTPDLGNFASPETYARQRLKSSNEFDPRYEAMWQELDQAASKLSPNAGPSEWVYVKNKWRAAVHDAAKRNNISGWEYVNNAEGAGEPSRVVFFGDKVRRTDASFDPSNQGSSRLLAGTSGSGEGGVASRAINEYAIPGAIGSVAGNEFDENGQPTGYDPLKGAAGAAAMILGPRALGKVLPKGPPLAVGPPRGPAQMTFGGVNAKTADKKLLGIAQDMEKAGAGRDQIWRETGWFKGVDGKWRFEIDDSAFKGRFGSILREKGELGDFFRDSDAQGAYPQMARAPAERSPDRGSSYDPDRGGRIEFSGRSGALHERQHGIQEAEGFAKGISPSLTPYKFRDPADQAKWDALHAEALAIMREVDIGELSWRAKNAERVRSDASVPEAVRRHHLANEPGANMRAYLDRYNEIRAESDAMMPRAISAEETYLRHAGEVEARNVQTRRDFTPDERRAKAPWETQDVPDEQQIVRYGSGRQESRPPQGPKPPPTGKGEKWYHSDLKGTMTEMDPAKGELGLHVGSKFAAGRSHKELSKLPGGRFNPTVREVEVSGNFAKTPDLGDFLSPARYAEARGKSPKKFDPRFEAMWRELDEVAPNAGYGRNDNVWREAVHAAAKKHGVDGWEYSNFEEGIGGKSRVIFNKDAVRIPTKPPSGRQESAPSAPTGGKGPPQVGRNGLTAGAPRPERGPVLHPSVIEELRRLSKTISPSAREAVSANAKLPIGARQSAVAASGYDPTVFEAAAPFQRTKTDTPLRNMLMSNPLTAQMVGPPKLNPVESGVRNALVDVRRSGGAPPQIEPLAETAALAEKQRRTAVSDATRVNNLLNPYSREAAGLPDRPLPKSAARKEQQATDMAIAARRALEAANVSALSQAEASVNVSQRLAQITEALTKRADGPPVSRRAARDMAKMLFESEYADALDAILSGRAIPRDASKTIDPRTILSVASVGGLGAIGWAAVVGDLSNRSESRNGLTAPPAPPPAMEPSDPRFVWDWEQVKKNRRAVQAIQIRLNELPPNTSGGRYNLKPDGVWGRNSEAAVKRWLWENGFDQEAGMTQEAWDMLDDQALQARRSTSRGGLASTRPASSSTPRREAQPATAQ